MPSYTPTGNIEYAIKGFDEKIKRLEEERDFYLRVHRESKNKK